VKNVTQGTPSDSDLQTVISAAVAGDRILVRNVCEGHFTVDRDLVIVGKATDDVAVPVPTAGGQGRVVAVSAEAVLRNLRITGGASDMGAEGSARR
jgi:hypothetical protein